MGGIYIPENCDSAWDIARWMHTEGQVKVFFGNEEMIYKQDREIYVSQGNLEEGGEFQFESGYMRKNLQRENHIHKKINTSRKSSQSFC